MDNVLTIAEAAAKYGIDEKRLLGAIWMENQTGKLQLPIGDYAKGLVQDDSILHLWVDKQLGG